MLRRLLIGLTGALVLVVVSTSAAWAWEQTQHAKDGNSRGDYSCSSRVSDDEQSYEVSCWVHDAKCDDRGVYVQSRFEVGQGRAYEQGDWVRSTPNAGGCGKRKLTDWKRHGNGLYTKDINWVHFRLCMDEPLATDTCWAGTEQQAR
ncbi:hypothetical protein [Nocardioides insulae]|uniref:hypothetical protein n=1 Tax=Nocardioides insulae TaxID=394734 RepID=UPI00040FA0A7|nr:hypothetical protein [Nocardioides insulae]